MRHTLIAAALTAAVILGNETPAAAADPDALWKTVHDRCVPNQLEHGKPEPCALVELRDGVDKGYAVLKDVRGDTQFLLIPTALTTGIETAALLAPDAPNYFAAAWHARTFTEAAVHRTMPRDAVGLAVNSVFGRSQNQLHIHIDCIRADVRDALHRRKAAIGDTWAPLDEPLAGHRYLVRRVMSEDLDGVDPFKLLADGVPDVKQAMGEQTLVLVGATFGDGRPGFVFLNDHADLAAGDHASGAALEDHTCALLGS